MRGGGEASACVSGFACQNWGGRRSVFSGDPHNPGRRAPSRMARPPRLSLILLLALVRTVGSSPCVGRGGAPVAWWFALTPPRGGGGAPAFADAADPTPRELENFAASFHSNGSGDPLAATLAGLFGEGTRADAVAWSDAPPDAPEIPTGAHSKGVLAFDGKSGVWLTHSAPKWPPPLDGPYAPPLPPQRVFAQSFLCVTLDAASFDAASTHVASAVAPRVFSARVGAAAAARFPGLAALAGAGPRPPPPPTGASCFRFHGLLACASTGTPPRDLWSAVLAPALRAPLAVATWVHEKGVLGPVCEAGTEAVLNVAASVWVSAHILATASHAKWSVTLAPAAAALCVGDTNRAVAQRGRAGGAVCLTEERALGDAARAAVRATDACRMQGGAGIAAV